MSKGMRFPDQFVYVVDGGLLSNFPLWLFDGERTARDGDIIPTIGFKLVGKTEGAQQNQRSLKHASGIG